jgi:hypothetical protein
MCIHVNRRFRPGIDSDKHESMSNPKSGAIRPSSDPIARNLPVAEVAAFLRALVGLPPTDGEGAVDASRPAPRAVDVTAWIGWALAGLYACALPSENAEGEARRRGPWVPPIRAMVREARRAAAVIAMVRHGGNVTRAAEALGTSRRALRDTLKRAGLYPWGGASEGEDDASEDDASTSAIVSSDVEAEAPVVAAKGGE